MIIILETFKQENTERFNKPEIYKKFRIITAAMGLIFICDALLHIILAININYINISYP